MSQGTPQPPKVQQAPANQTKWHEFVLASVIIIAVLILAGYLIVTTQDMPSATKVKLIVFLVCFPIAAALVFIGSTKSAFSGTLAGFAVSLTGAAAITAVFYLLITMSPTADGAAHAQTVQTNGMSSLSGKSFEQWMPMTGINQVIAANEEDTITRLVSGVYYPANNHPKLDNPRIEVLTAYLDPTRTIMFRRFIGKNSGKAIAQIFSHVTTSLPGDSSQALQIAYVADRKSIRSVPMGASKSGQWLDITSAPGDIVDCLIITVYREPELLRAAGDFLVLDVPKWVDSSRSTADIAYSLVSHIPLRSEYVKFWNVTPAPPERQIPLSFSPLTWNLERSTREVNTIGSWLETIQARLDSSAAEGDEVRAFPLIRSVMKDSKGNPIQFRQLIDDKDAFFPHRYTLRSTSQSTPLVLTFMWE